MNIPLALTLTQDDIEQIINKAYAMGYRREDPERRWTDRERRSVVRWFIYRKLDEAIGR